MALKAARLGLTRKGGAAIRYGSANGCGGYCGFAARERRMDFAAMCPFAVRRSPPLPQQPKRPTGMGSATAVTDE